MKLLRGMTVREFVRRLYRDVVDDAITDTAAQLSYYFLFALFPFLFFVVTVSAYFPIQDTAQAMLQRLAYVMPDQAMALLNEHLSSLFGETRPKLVTFTLVAALWTASRGVDALRKALNLAYGVAETRPYWKTQVLALVATVAGVLGWMVALSVLALGGRAGQWIAREFALIDEFYLFWASIRWPVILVLVMLNAGVMYWALPNVKLKFRVVSWGTSVGAVLWIGATWVFTEYVDNFGRFNVTYGSIGGVVVLMLWLYISGLILIFGGEINALLDSADPAVAEVKPPEEREPVPAGAAKRADSARRMRRRIWKVFRRRET